MKNLQFSRASGFCHRCMAIVIKFCDWSLRNPAYQNMSLLNANFPVNQMSLIICRWKLVKHLDCFGVNRRAKDTSKIKLCSLRACCTTLFSYSISHNFPTLKRWNEKSEVKLKKILIVKINRVPKRQASEKSKATFLSPAKSAKRKVICM